ncbi:unnamed protein product [Orchesella dallaii]|uniref:t-SNARE coiled-coil homology domain-containing protein n=1 Tax=Orchesella dallaii TaxID=48710 RepID=A0ABP1QK64_9HEXA
MESLYQNYSTTDFHRKAQAVASNIHKISQNVSSMNRMLQQIGSGHDVSTSTELRSQLHKITHYTGVLAKDTSSDLKELNKFNLVDQKQLKIQRDKLTQDFGAVLNSFQGIQRQAAQKEKELLKAETSSQSWNLEGPSAGGIPPPTSRDSKSRQMQLMMEDETTIEETRQREQAIRQLESDILDVNQIFKELATMVHEQGETIDSIEANIESAHIQVEEGVRQVSQAHTYQNKARIRKLQICIALFIIVMVLIAIIWMST